LDKASLQGEVPTKIRRYFKRCMRYIEAYNQGMDAEGAYSAVVGKFVERTEGSHRRLNANK
jgi:hypothetical protein